MKVEVDEGQARAQVPVSKKEVPACSNMRLAEGPGDDEHHLVQKVQRLPSPGLQGASWERETKVDDEKWGWTSTCSVLSAIVASQAATEKPVWAPRPSASTGAAGATVTPRSPLPGAASSREVLGPLARHSARPGACAEARCLVAHGSKSANPKEAATAQAQDLTCFNALVALA